MMISRTVYKAQKFCLWGICFLCLGGCTLIDAPLFNPVSSAAQMQRDLMFAAIGLMLIVIVPVFILTFWFALKYRASNTKAKYLPNWSYSARLDAIVWLIPFLIVATLGVLVWIYTHRLDPYKQADKSTAPLEINVIALNWKWLFIYPHENIATVNELVVPAGQPVRLNLTSDTVMNSLYIPGLAGQIYAMAGMRTELNFKANHPMNLVGRNTQYSGGGFANQIFKVRIESKTNYRAWVKSVKQANKALDALTYGKLAQPSPHAGIIHYSTVRPDLFVSIIGKYTTIPAQKHQKAAGKDTTPETP